MDSTRSRPLITVDFFGGGLLVGLLSGVTLLLGSDVATVLAGAAIEGLGALAFAVPLAAAWWAARRFLRPLSPAALPNRVNAHIDMIAGMGAIAALPMLSATPPVVATITALLVALLVGILAQRFGRWPLPAIAAGSLILLIITVTVLKVDAATPSTPFTGPPADAPIPAADAPNILLVSIDTLRADCLGAESDGMALMPQLDGLAAQGIQLKAWASSNQTGPTHTSLYTGRGFLEHPVNQNGIPLPDSIPTIAEMFSAIGWDTRGVIANPLLAGTMGLARGFHAYDDRLVRAAPFEQAFRTLRATSPRIRFASAILWKLDRNRRTAALFTGGSVKDKRRAPLVVEKAEDLLATAASDRPWFLLAHFLDPHGPYDAPGEFRYRLAAEDGGGISGTPKPIDFLEELDGHAAKGDRAALVTEFRARYEEEVMYLDHWLGELLESVRERTGDRPLWIVVTSDHGEHFIEHGKLGHGNSPFEDLVRAVMVISGPGVQSRTDLPITSEEVGPFLLSLAVGGDHQPRREPMQVQGYQNILSAQLDGWKLILEADEAYGSYQPTALYHLTEDPSELVDRLAAEPERVKDMLRTLEQRRDRDRPFDSSSMREDDDMQAILREMGYVH